MSSAKALSPITISSLRGGLDDNDPPTSLSQDSCTVAENVEFYLSTLGERRAGCIAINLPTSITADPTIDTVSWMGVHYPTNALGAIELWELAQGITGSNSTLSHNALGTWATVTPNDPITVTSGFGSQMRGTSLHAKFYLAHKSAFDRLHVWDGSTLRRTGLLPPAAAPTGADTGSGSYGSARYFRVRFTVVSGSVILRRSEPSPVLTFTPSGSGSGVIITKPASLGEGETNWEVEASTDNANFYRIASPAVGTTTYTDSTVFATGYVSGILSEQLTAYTVIPSGRYMTTDADRLLSCGSWENPNFGSRIWWTPVLGATGVGNDERLDMTVNPYIDLDGFEGGDLTGVSQSLNGYFYAFKWQHIYKIIRNGQLTNAYQATPITKSRGAFPGSVIDGVDQSGNPALYFLDPQVGPMRIGIYGMEWLGRDIRNLWSRVNQNASVPAHGVFYQSKNQVHFWVALDGSDHPNAKIIVHCDEIVSDANGGRRGWVTVPVGNRIADAYCSCMFSANVDSGDIRSFDLVPFIGKTQWSVAGNTIKNLIQRCDVGTTDAFTTNDTAAYYYASVQTRPFAPMSFMTKTGLLAGTLVLASSGSPSNDVHVRADKDFGLETKLIGVPLFPQANETILVKRLDNLNFADLNTVQITFGDLDRTVLPTTTWQLHLFAMKITAEQSS